MIHIEGGTIWIGEVTIRPSNALCDGFVDPPWRKRVEVWPWMPDTEIVPPPTLQELIWSGLVRPILWAISSRDNEAAHTLSLWMVKLSPRWFLRWFSRNY
jgi:hypothetical protein